MRNDQRREQNSTEQSPEYESNQTQKLMKIKPVAESQAAASRELLWTQFSPYNCDFEGKWANCTFKAALASNSLEAAA